MDIVPQWVIEKKRDGLALSGDEIQAFIDGYTREDIPDYQMAALAMAIYLQGMTFEETAALTDAMMRTGAVLDTSGIGRPKADKHSTGGIGDKISLVLGPLAAACGLAVPMISGRGLGITGGTLDKLESIPGYRTDLSEDEFLTIVNEVGCSIIGQTAQMAPADKKLYALRDVTGTVPSIPLITASIMCKKMAEGLDALVLDVKWGSGAFMKERAAAEELADSMVRVGQAMGKKVTSVLTDMNQPLGRAVGNRLEVIESMDALSGQGPDDIMQVTEALTVEMLLATGVCADTQEAGRLIREKLDDGSARDCFLEMVRRQGGDTDALEDDSKMPGADRIELLAAEASGVIAHVDAEKVGKACLLLGAGRRKTTDAVHFGVGVDRLVKVGEAVQAGDPLMRVHMADGYSNESALVILREAVDIKDEAPAVGERIGSIHRGTAS